MHFDGPGVIAGAIENIMTLQIELQGMQELQNWIDEGSNAAMLSVPDIKADIFQFHTILENRVASLYSSKSKLSSVLQGGKARFTSNNNKLSFELNYVFKPIALGKFAMEQDASSSESMAPLRVDGSPLGFVKWTLGQYSTETKVAIRKGKYNTSNPRSKQSTFKVFEIRGRLAARLQKATWNEYPAKGSLGKYAPVTLMFGPPLVAQLGSLFKHNDSVVLSAQNRLEENILKTLLRYYK